MAVQNGFKLSMRLVADALERLNVRIEYYPGKDANIFERLRIYYEGQTLRPRTIYLIRAEEWTPSLIASGSCGYVILGEVPLTDIQGNCPVILVMDQKEILYLHDQIQELFYTYEKWNRELQTALDEDRPLEAILNASVPVFRNPMFIHDNNFCVLAYSGDILRVHTWSRDLKTGRDVVEMSIRNDFQVDQEYLDGLNKRHAVLFSANQRGYPILYRNLYDENRYMGRVLVDELSNAIQPGDFAVIDYLGDFIQNAIREKSLLALEYGGLMEQEISRILDGESPDEQSVRQLMTGMEWEQDDAYRCMKIVPFQPEAYLVSNAVMAERLHVLLPSCCCVLYKDGVVVIFNMTRINKSIQEIVTGLAIFIRDGLLKVGISSEYDGFFHLPNGYRQADIAVRLGQRSESMYWYYYFDQFMLEYATESMLRDMPLEILSADALHALKKYDEKNHTELYRTLKIYLRLERNLLQTSKTLFIHRSTLAYRIERIIAITGVDLESSKERLKLLFSYALEEFAERKS